MSIAYASRVFEFSDVHVLPNYAAETPPRCLNAIRHLRLKFDIDIEPFVNLVMDFHDGRGSLAFFHPWWKIWEVVADMRGLEEIQVHIGNTSLEFDDIEEGDEVRILGPLCAITQTKTFNVTVEWRLLGAETSMSKTPFHIIHLDKIRKSRLQSWQTCINTSYVHGVCDRYT